MTESVDYNSVTNPNGGFALVLDENTAISLIGKILVHNVAVNDLPYGKIIFILNSHTGVVYGPWKCLNQYYTHYPITVKREAPFLTTVKCHYFVKIEPLNGEPITRGLSWKKLCQDGVIPIKWRDHSRQRYLTDEQIEHCRKLLTDANRSSIGNGVFPVMYPPNALLFTDKYRQIVEGSDKGTCRLVTDVEAENRPSVFTPTLADVVGRRHKIRKAIENNEDTAAYNDSVATERRGASDNF